MEDENYLELKDNETLTEIKHLSSKVEHLSLEDLTNLCLIDSFPTTLKTLYLRNCPNLKVIPSFPDGIEKIYLISLPIDKLQNVPSSLKILVLVNCPNVRTVPPLLNLNLLQTLDIRKSIGITRLPKLPKELKYLLVGGCDDLVKPEIFPNNLIYTDI